MISYIIAASSFFAYSFTETTRAFTVRAPSVKTVAVTAALTPKAGASFDEAKAAVMGALAA